MSTIKLSQLELEVIGYERIQANDYYDANWLMVSVTADTNGINTKFARSCLLTSDLVEFNDQLINLNSGRKDSATLESFEPNIELSITKVDSLGHLKMIVKLIPTDENFHQFSLQIDQSYLPLIIADIKDALLRYPVRLESVQ